MPYSDMVHTVIQTLSFEADVKSAKMGDDEVTATVDYVASHPMGGDLMVGTGGVRKARIAKPGTGKSGGYRVVWWFGGDDIPVFLLSVFGKAECNALRRLTATLRESLTRQS
jgi:hypothetical protein